MTISGRIGKLVRIRISRDVTNGAKLLNNYWQVQNPITFASVSHLASPSENSAATAGSPILSSSPATNTCLKNTFVPAATFLGKTFSSVSGNERPTVKSSLKACHKEHSKSGTTRRIHSSAHKAKHNLTKSRSNKKISLSNIVDGMHLMNITPKLKETISMQQRVLHHEAAMDSGPKEELCEKPKVPFMDSLFEGGSFSIGTEMENTQNKLRDLNKQNQSCLRENLKTVQSPNLRREGINLTEKVKSSLFRWQMLGAPVTGPSAGAMQPVKKLPFPPVVTVTQSLSSKTINNDARLNEVVSHPSATQMAAVKNESKDFIEPKVGLDIKNTLMKPLNMEMDSSNATVKVSNAPTPMECDDANEKHDNFGTSATYKLAKHQVPVNRAHPIQYYQYWKK